MAPERIASGHQRPSSIQAGCLSLGPSLAQREGLFLCKANPSYGDARRFNKKSENPAAVVSLHFSYYDFGRARKSLADPY
jgi:hypothetical protein